jgi:predicted CXXCH cytochrome family protein
VAVYWIWPKQPHDSESAGQSPNVQPSTAQADTYSNVRHEDYVGPALCKDCHEERYLQWSDNLHRKMNRLVTEAGAVLGDFEDRRVPYADGVLHLHREKGHFFMSFEKEEKTTRRYRVTRTIGSRYLQEYVGIQELGPEPADDPVYATEIRLPFGYLFRTKRWLPQQYFDSWHGVEYGSDDTLSSDTFDPDKSPWRGRCAWCHNTYSFDKRLARLQGETQVGNGIEQFYVDSISSSESISDKNLLPIEELVTVGISCESCHFGAREHATEDRPIRFAPENAQVTGIDTTSPLAGTRTDSRTINAICAQCHSAPTELYPNGAGTRNSSEALDLLSGECASRIKCTDCHDPHIPGPGAMAPLEEKHIDACMGCHGDFVEEAAALEHSGHTAEVSCLDCHMPKIVQGISSLLRTHRISSPGETSMLTKGVNACNLCHLDRSVEWTVIELRSRYGLSLSLAEISDTPAALLWLGSEERIHRLTAAGALGMRPEGRAFLPKLVDMLNDPVAYDRQRYLWAIEEALGRTLGEDEFSITGTPEWRRNQVSRLRKSLIVKEKKKKRREL